MAFSNDEPPQEREDAQHHFVVGRPVVELRNVSKTYRVGPEEIVALKDVDFVARAGEAVLVLGPSGGGKSTLLHILGGMDRPTSGDVVADDTVLNRLSPDQLSAYRRRYVGFVFQAFHLLPTRSALENVEIPLFLAGVPKADRRSRGREVLERMGLGDRARNRPSQLSGGQVQRVAVARALAADPPLILADEPTGNLDSARGREVMRELVRLAHDDGRSVVVVSHNQEFAALFDRVVHVRDGRIIEAEHQASGVKAGPGAEVATAVGPAYLAAGQRHPAHVGHVGALALSGMALGEVGRRKVRTILTALGITIGVAAMVLLVSVGAGLNSSVVSAVVASGPLDTIMVTPQAQSPFVSFNGTGFSSGKIHPLTPAVIRHLAALPGARTAFGFAYIGAGAQYGTRSGQVYMATLAPRRLWGIAGLTPKLAAGALPRHGTRSVILPLAVGQALFGGHLTARALVGRSFLLTPLTYQDSGGSAAPLASSVTRAERVRIAGVTKSLLGNPTVYVSYNLGTNWLRATFGARHAIDYSGAAVLARGVSNVATMAKRIRALGYGTTTMGQIVGQVQHTFAAVEVGLGAVGGIALVVAGLMIAVVMSMTVLERRREIGVLRAMGARRRDIFFLFLTEAAVIGLIGGLLGDGIGWMLGKAGMSVTHIKGLFLVPPWLAFLGLGFGTVVAVLAGAVPAGHAARLNPVDALHSE